MSVTVGADRSNVHPHQPLRRPPPPVVVVVVRVYDRVRDKAAVEELERLCEVGEEGKPSVVTDLMGDPTARISLFPSHVTLVAEYGCNGEIVGVIRGCVKSVTTGKKTDEFPVFVKFACILGLRVSPAHRRLGIGTKLVHQLEQWCKKHGADYAYMATECNNQPSLNLFTKKCNYIKFRSPEVLVQPVHAHKKSLHRRTSFIRVPPYLAGSMYSSIFSECEFFPKDMDTILNSKLNLGTFMACPKGKWDPKSGSLPPSYAILSIWDVQEVFKIRVKGVSGIKHAWSAGTRVLDALLPCLRLPSIPNVFTDFGFYFLYGLHMEGHHGSDLMKSLCAYAHNLARDDRGVCRILVAEVSRNDPARGSIPHWRRFSWDDLWCIKRLSSDYEEGEGFKPESWPWVQSPASVTFVDPRDL